MQGAEWTHSDRPAVPRGLDALYGARTQSESRNRRGQRRFRILQLGRPIQHARPRRKYSNRDRHELRFAASIYPHYEKRDDPACAVPDGILLKRNGRPDRQPERRLERPRNLGDLRRGKSRDKKRGGGAQKKNIK